MVARLLALIALLSAGQAAAQQSPAPPASNRPPARTAPHAAPRRETAPVVQAKPGTAAKHPTVHSTAPIPAPTPTPAPPPVAEKPPEPAKGSVTGMPLPRFAALRADEVYMRIGPGKRYPIIWVYKRSDLPVQIEREFEDWRLVRDQDNTKGWVHQATLVPRRTGVVTGGEQVLRQDSRDDAEPVARLKPGVIVRLRACDAASDWCQAQVQDYRGWMKRSEVWGLLPGESIQ
jgi:SH3-like domain-containing protein